MPNRCNKIVLANDAIVIADEMHKKVEHFRRYGEQTTLAAQLTPIRIEHVVFEMIRQSSVPDIRSVQARMASFNEKGHPKEGRSPRKSAPASVWRAIIHRPHAEIQS